jgi:hypothetical protein
MQSLHGAVQSPELQEEGGSRDQEVPNGHRWSDAEQGTKGQILPPLEPRLPWYLFIVSFSLQPIPPQPPFCHLHMTPLRQKPSSRTPKRAWQGVPRPPALGVSRKVGAAGEWEGGSRWRGQEGGVRVYESRPTALLFNTHFSRKSCH